MLFAGTYDGTGGEPDLRTVANGGQIQNTVSVGGVTVPADMVFSSDNTGATLLKWQVVYYDPVTGLIIAWVKIPTLDSSTDTDIYIVFGDSGVTTWQGDVTGTWNSSYLFMVHGSNVLTDSTSNARDFSCATPGYSTGKFGTCIRTDSFGGTSPSRSDSGLPTGTSDRTIKMWVSWLSTSHANSGIFAYGNQGTNEQDQRIRQSAFSGGGEVLKYLASSDDATASFNPTIGQFYFLVCTFNSSGTVAKIYIDGSNIGTVTKSSWNTVLGGTVSIGTDTFAGTDIDVQEVAMRDVVESADEILAAYNNQNSPSTFYSLVGSSPAVTSVRETADHIEIANSQSPSLRDTADHIEIANSQVPTLRETSDHIEVATTESASIRVTADHIEVAVQVLEARCYLDWDLVCDDSLFSQDARCLIPILLKCTGFDPDHSAICNLHWTLEAIPPGSFTGEKCLTDESGGGGSGSGGSYTF